jgi:hypothetical protein
MKPFGRATSGSFIVAILMAMVTGCAGEAALQRLQEARRLTAELLVQFTKAADATNRVVMADTDEASGAFAREAEQVTQAVQRNSDALKPLLVGLGYSKESQLLEEFDGRFAEYRALDRSILELALENTNVKAQRLSFGPAQEAANAFRDSVEALARSAPANSWQIRALAATAVSAVREIQVLQAAHIPEADDTAMTRIEKQMATAESAARRALKTLADEVPPEAKPELATAAVALDRFIGLNTQIIGLSRRNTNVRSLALSLGEKGTLTARCEESLRALEGNLVKRGFSGTR